MVKPMKWTSYIKDKVGLGGSTSTTNRQTGSSSSFSSASTSSSRSPFSISPTFPGPVREDSKVEEDFVSAVSNAREKDDPELEFKILWEEFLSSKFEKEKEMALKMALDIFCRLAKQNANGGEFVVRLVGAHVFSFAIGRAFVTNFEKLRIQTKAKSLHVNMVMGFFSPTTTGGISHGLNLLYALEVLVSGMADKQPLLDSGILCCHIHILKALLDYDKDDKKQSAKEEDELTEKVVDDDIAQVCQIEVEGIIVHIIKALASHPSAGSCLTEDDSLQLLFQMVADGSKTVFSLFKKGLALVPLHTIQLHRHAMQILELLLVNNNGSMASYIHKHHLINVLLMIVKDFEQDDDDADYAVGIVDVLLECVDLSYRPEAGSISLREDIHNAHGYQFLVQFTLKLSRLQGNKVLQSSLSRSSFQETTSESTTDNVVGFNQSHTLNLAQKENADILEPTPYLCPSLNRLLDIIVSLAQTGPMESATRYSGKINDDILEKVNTKVQDLVAIQMLQDIFAKTDCIKLQAEVLDRAFRIFLDHLDNYKLCQEVRVVPFFITNMAGIPSPLQDMILKMVEYAVTVVNCIPEQELLSLCCLLQQSTASNLKLSLLSFFVKLLSFNHQYKKILWDVGLLEVLINDLLQHTLVSGSDQLNNRSSNFERKFSFRSNKKYLDDRDSILSSSRLSGHNDAKVNLFAEESTISLAWECLISLITKSETNKSFFLSDNGFNIVLPFLISGIHRSNVLHFLSCLIFENNTQVHPEEFGILIEVLKSGMVVSVSGLQYELPNDAKIDILGALWHVLEANNTAKRVFGEATGFSLLLMVLQSFHNDVGLADFQSLANRMKVFSSLLRVMTIAVRDDASNRSKLHTILSTQTFCDLLYASKLICVDWELQTVCLLMELALEIVLPPNVLQGRKMPSDDTESASEVSLSNNFLDVTELDRKRVYNASSVAVLIRSLLLFTPKLQQELLSFIEKLASTGSFNQENLTSTGCVGLLLDTISPYLTSSSPLLIPALRIVEVLGAYKLSTLELRVLMRYILQMKSLNSGHYLVDMLGKLIQTAVVSENVSLAPYVEMDNSRIGHASIHVSLGERTWPPSIGYTFVCWFQYLKPKDKLLKDDDNNGEHSISAGHLLHFFSIGSTDDHGIICAELYLQDNGVLTLTTSNSFSLSFSDLELEEGKWYHLALVHSRLSTLKGLFQTSVAYVYLNGKLSHSGKLRYSPLPVGKLLHMTIGTPLTHSKLNNLCWRLRCCYLFEEVLTSGSICLMYILGRGYRGIFQDTNLLQFVPLKASGAIAILGSLDAEPTVGSNVQKLDGSAKEANHKPDSNGEVWETERLRNLSIQLTGKRLVFAFDGASSEAYGTFGKPSLLNLVDPTSMSASSIGGIPRIGHLVGDSYLCHQCVIGDNIRGVGGVLVILAMVEAAKTRDMLHMSLALLASALNQNPQNALDMLACRGYHLLAIFLHHRMALFDMQSLDIFFQIAACEGSSLESPELQGESTIIPSYTRTPQTSFKDYSLQNHLFRNSPTQSYDDLDDSSTLRHSFSNFSEFESADLPEETSNCVILANVYMVEHVMLDWTLWVTAPVSIQLALVGFLEKLLTIPSYMSHNLRLLRQINLVQYILVTLQRGDVEVPVLEKLVLLLSVILEDGFLVSELEAVVRFVIMTFDPPELRNVQEVEASETMGKHVIVRNLLLEMLVDLRLGITSEEFLEQWHDVLSLKFVLFFLDKYLHPTSMKWIMTLLGVWLVASPTFSHEFQSSGGYQLLTRVLPGFHDHLEIFYILLCLIFGKAVYPRIPVISIGDFYALISCVESREDLNFVELLDSVIAMAKFAFDILGMRPLVASKSDNIDFKVDSISEELTYEQFMSEDAASLDVANSVLRFMVSLAKMSSSFSAICRRVEFLESCADLYFSCVRAFECSNKMDNDHATDVVMEDEVVDIDDDSNVQHMLLCPPQLYDQFPETSESTRNFHQEITTTISEDFPRAQNLVLDNNAENEERYNYIEISNASSTHGSSGKSNSITETASISPSIGSQYASLPSSSPIIALTSWLGSRGINNNESKVQPSVAQVGQFMGSPISEISVSPQKSTDNKEQPCGSLPLTINPKLLFEISASGMEEVQSVTGAKTILDFIAIILADIVLEQSKGSQYVENILEVVPLYVDLDSALVFQGICLGRLMKFLERRLLQVDEDDEGKFEKSIWSVNVGALCWIIVDHVYMGAFPKPFDVLETLEFLLSLLAASNKDGSVEKVIPSGKGMLSMARGGRQHGAYVHALLKCVNRMIMYCFLPSFLTTIDEVDFLSRLGFQPKPMNILLPRPSHDDCPIDVCSVLQMVLSHKQLIFCPSNIDTTLVCCFCINLISLLKDPRQTACNLAMDIMKYLLLHRKNTLEELLASKSHQGQHLNVLHGGFDQLLTETSATFFEWLHKSEEFINIVLDQSAALMWGQYIVGSEKFPGSRIKAMENRCKREMERKYRDIAKLDSRHFEHISARRNDLKVIRDSMSKELRIIHQNKYSWVLHAESEWQAHVQQLFHERGIIPIKSSLLEPAWQLCPIEGPYRMRKRLERSRLKIETIQSYLIGDLELKDNNSPSQKNLTISESFTDSFLNHSSDGVSENGFVGADGYKDEESIYSPTGWNGDEDSGNVNEESSHSAMVSIDLSDTMDDEKSLDSPRMSSSTKSDDIRAAGELENKLHDNGEYLIRPYLQPDERIRFKYNCERVLSLDKHDGIFLIGEQCLYVIENFYVDDSGCICEKKNEDALSVIDQALGVEGNVTNGSSDVDLKKPSSGPTVKPIIGSGRAWAYNGGTWGKNNMDVCGILHHPWHMWKLGNVSELLKRDYQLRHVAIEIFSTDGCNDLLIFHRKEREEVFKNIVSMNLPKNMLDRTISGLTKQENNEGSRLFKVTAKSFSKRWQNGEISNFQYLMHLNTLAGRGYSDLTQYPVFPWILADYESQTLDLSNPKTFRKLDRPMGCQTEEGKEEFKKRYENWEDPEVPKFHYGSHYSSSGIVLFYLLRLPPFSTENQNLQGGQFDRADRLFGSISDTWLSAIGGGNTSDVKELIPEFFYMPEFLENRFNLDLGEKQSGEKVGDVVLPPWAKGTSREFIRMHREALECDYVSENLHHWIDLIFGYKQRGEAAKESVNVFYHYTYEGNVDIDSITDPTLKASILAQINHFGQTPKQLFLKPHVKRSRRSDMKFPLHHPLCHCKYLFPRLLQGYLSSSISQIVMVNEKILVAGQNNLLCPVTYNEYVAWGFPDQSLRFINYDQDKILSIHENLHFGQQIQCVGLSHDGQTLVTSSDDGSAAAWKIITKTVSRGHQQQELHLLQMLCAHTAKITCLYVCQPYMLLVTGSDDHSVIIWDLSGLSFVKQLAEFPAPVSAVHINDLTGEIVTAAGILLSVWSINGDCLATVNTSQLGSSDLVLSVTTVAVSDWQDVNWYVTGHLSGDIKIWNMVHKKDQEHDVQGGAEKEQDYRLVLCRVLKVHGHPVTALHLTSDLKQLLSGDSNGCLFSWSLPEEVSGMLL